MTVTIRDTVEVTTTDTLYYCPKTNDELTDLFEAFTGVADSSTTGTGKAVSSIQLRSWGRNKGPCERAKLAGKIRSVRATPPQRHRWESVPKPLSHAEIKRYYRHAREAFKGHWMGG